MDRVPRQPSGHGERHLGGHLLPSLVGLEVARPRRPGLRRAARGRRADLRGHRERHRVRPQAADTGAVLWSTHVGTPVPSGDLPCGDISPTVGITGTPVVDEARGEIFAVADELMQRRAVPRPGGDRTSTPGSSSWDRAWTRRLRTRRPSCNARGSTSATATSSSATAATTATARATRLDRSRSPKAAARPASTRRCPSATTGPCGWAARRPRSMRPGTSGWPPGTARDRSPYDFSDSVLELSPSLCRTQYFAPSSWQTDNNTDLDLGSTAPALLSDGAVLQVGKSSTPTS